MLYLKTEIKGNSVASVPMSTFCLQAYMKRKMPWIKNTTSVLCRWLTFYNNLYSQNLKELQDVNDFCLTLACCSCRPMYLYAPYLGQTQQKEWKVKDNKSMQQMHHGFNTTHKPISSNKLHLVAKQTNTTSWIISFRMGQIITSYYLHW